jgi:hypothetical protein
MILTIVWMRRSRTDQVCELQFRAICQSDIRSFPILGWAGLEPAPDSVDSVVWVGATNCGETGAGPNGVSCSIHHFWHFGQK